jgi:hypothetical protein
MLVISQGKTGEERKKQNKKLRPGSELLFCFVSFFLQKKKKKKKKKQKKKKKKKKPTPVSL